MIMFKYYIPLIYTYKTRYNSILRFLSFLFFTCLPSFYIVIINNEINTQLIISYIVTFIVMYSLYECGYLFNDIVTINFEKNPTLRIEQKYIKISSKHLENMLTVRLAIVVLGCFWLYQFTINIKEFCITLLLLFITYSLHNFYRDRTNIVTMFSLVFLKNFLLVIPFIPTHKFLEAGLIIIITIAAIRTYEFAAKDRFNLNIKINNVDLFRVEYYFALTFATLFLYVFGVVSYKFIIINLFFLVYRVLIYFLLKLNNRSKFISNLLKTLKRGF